MVPYTAPIRPVDATGDCRRKIAGKSPETAGKSKFLEFAGIHRIFRGVHTVEPDRASESVERRIRGSRCAHDGTLAVADRRRHEVISLIGSASLDGGAVRMGRIFLVELEGRVYKCQYCLTHLALADDLVSRSFHSRTGKAYLFNNCANIEVGVNEERMMLSGLHVVADVFCCCCGQIVGWKYMAAVEKSQKYKEGKYVLERGRIVDGIDSEFFLDNHLSGSDAEEP